MKSSASAPVAKLSAAAGEQQLTVPADGMRGEESREAGPVHVLATSGSGLELDAILEEADLSEGAGHLTLAMALNRLIHPASELVMSEWIRSTELADILGVDSALAEDAIYRNLDKLRERRVAIETVLAEREQKLFGLDPTVFLHDVTSTYPAEGRAMGDAHAQRRYSRDHRGDCKQLLVGR